MSSIMKEERKTLLDKLTEFVKAGYRCYICKDKSYSYGFLMSPAGNLFEVDYDFSKGFNVSLSYCPTHENGSGCSCNNAIPFYPENFSNIENSGLVFAKSLHARFYTSEQILDHVKTDLVKEIKNEAM